MLFILAVSVKQEIALIARFIMCAASSTDSLCLIAIKDCWETWLRASFILPLEFSCVIVMSVYCFMNSHLDQQNKMLELEIIVSVYRTDCEMSGRRDRVDVGV